MTASSDINGRLEFAAVKIALADAGPMPYMQKSCFDEGYFCKSQAFLLSDASGITFDLLQTKGNKGSLFKLLEAWEERCAVKAY